MLVVGCLFLVVRCSLVDLCCVSCVVAVVCLLLFVVC